MACVAQATTAATVRCALKYYLNESKLVLTRLRRLTRLTRLTTLRRLTRLTKVTRLTASLSVRRLPSCCRGSRLRWRDEPIWSERLEEEEEDGRQGCVW